MKGRSPKAEGRKQPEIRNLNGLASGRYSRIGCWLLMLFVGRTAMGITNRPPPEVIPPLRPPRGEIPPSFWEQHSAWVIVLGVLLLGLVAGAIWWLRRPRPAIVVEPETQARQELEPLRGRPEDGAVLSRISQILRRYVVAAFRLPPGEATTADFCRAMAEDGRLGSELSASLSDFMRSCDEHKFAPPAPRPALGAVERGFKLIEIAEVRRAELRGAEAEAPRVYRGRSRA